MLAGHPHAQRRDPVELAGEHLAGQPVGRKGRSDPAAALENDVEGARDEQHQR